jgi:hypothetical protein
MPLLYLIQPRLASPSQGDLTCYQFDSYISTIFDLKIKLRQKNINLRLTRDLLLPKLISGEIDVEALDIDIPEIAEVEEQQETPSPTPPEPINATQLALFSR